MAKQNIEVIHPQKTRLIQFSSNNWHSQIECQLKIYNLWRKTGNHFYSTRTNKNFELIHTPETHSFRFPSNMFLLQIETMLKIFTLESRNRESSQHHEDKQNLWVIDIQKRAQIRFSSIKAHPQIETRLTICTFESKILASSQDFDAKETCNDSHPENSLIPIVFKQVPSWNINPTKNLQPRFLGTATSQKSSTPRGHTNL